MKIILKTINNKNKIKKNGIAAPIDGNFQFFD